MDRRNRREPSGGGGGSRETADNRTIEGTKPAAETRKRTHGLYVAKVGEPVPPSAYDRRRGRTSIPPGSKSLSTLECSLRWRGGAEVMLR
jgi:hypothetical protein